MVQIDNDTVGIDDEVTATITFTNPLKITLTNLVLNLEGSGLNFPEATMSIAWVQLFFSYWNPNIRTDSYRMIILVMNLDQMNRLSKWSHWVQQELVLEISLLTLIPMNNQTFKTQLLLHVINSFRIKQISIRPRIIVTAH